MKKRFILILIMLCSFQNLFSQEKDFSKTDWLSVGAGIGEKKHISRFISYTFVDENIYQFSINGNQKFSLFGVSNKEYVVSTSFMYGEKVNWLFVFGGLFAGPSVVFGKKQNENIKYTIGVNISGQFLFSPTDVLGVGVDVFANLNFYEPVYGLRLAIYFKSIK